MVYHIQLVIYWKGDIIMRVVLAKMGLDGHDKGLRLIARALRDSGIEVIYLGLRQSADAVVQAALQDDADAIGISILSGSHIAISKKLMLALEKSGLNCPVVMGGTITEEDTVILKQIGIDEVFRVESSLNDIIGYFKGFKQSEIIKQPNTEQTKSIKKEATTESGIPIKPIYTNKDVERLNYEQDLGAPGRYPYTRGPYNTMYREKVWTMRQYSGFGTAIESNERYKYLLKQGQTGLSVAFDLPTQLGYDSNNLEVAEEVGRIGVAIDTVEDMHTLFKDIPLDSVSVSFTINSTAMIILAMYVVMAEERGYDRKILSGTVQNDMIKEFLSRNTFIFPLEASMRLVGDIISYSSEQFPKFNPISCSGYHIRELGANAIQELATTIGAGIVYVQEVQKRGIPVDNFAPRLSFELGSSQEIFEEVAKYRAARRMWARVMKERFNAQDEKSYKFRVFAGGNGISLTAKEPLNNIVRCAYQCLVGALGGAQAIHVPAYDEAYAIPTEESALLCLRTQQIAAYETGITKTVDPLAGSYYVESLTDELEIRANELLNKIEEMGGMIECIKNGWIQKEVISCAYKTQKDIESGDKVVVGVNKYASNKQNGSKIKIQRASEHVLNSQIERLEKVKVERNTSQVLRELDELKSAANLGYNLFPYVIDAVKARASIEEIVKSMKEVFGEYKGEITF